MEQLVTVDWFTPDDMRICDDGRVLIYKNTPSKVDRSI